jgi:hypothetical protein
MTTFADRPLPLQSTTTYSRPSAKSLPRDQRATAEGDIRSYIALHHCGW